MSSLTPLEKRTFEILFDMSGGYVLRFSNREMKAFFLNVVGINIYDDKYGNNSGSKASRLRAFWAQEPDHVVVRVLTAMLDLAVECPRSQYQVL